MERCYTQLRIISSLWLLLLTTVTLVGQDKFRPFTYNLQLNAHLATDKNLPFWLTANQFGTVPKNGSSVALVQSIRSRPDTSKKFFKVSYGAELVAITGRTGKLILPEAYLAVKTGKFEWSAGRRKMIYGLVDTTLSSGSISWSGNALPLPQVTLAIPEYTKVLFKWLAIKGHFSHGWFGKQDFVVNYFLHQKSLYGRIGTPNGRLKLYAGLLHNAQWGGTPVYEDTSKDPFGKFLNGKFPEDWFTYRQVVFPTKPLWDSTKYGYFEYSNRFGNHLGQIDLGGELRFKKGKLLAYKQTYFESGQTFSSLTNVDDGLYGLSYSSLKKNSILSRLTLEYLTTLNQGKYRSPLARLLGLPDRHNGEQTFYFNHMQYLDGWSYNDVMIGSPFMIPQENIRVEKQSGVITNFLNNNRVRAYYIGMQNRINSVDIITRFSISKNFGAYGYEITPARQQSFCITNRFPLPKLKGNLSITIAIDQGDLIRDNYGTTISYTRSW